MTEVKAWYHSTSKSEGETKEEKQRVQTALSKTGEKGVTAKTRLCLWEEEFEDQRKGRKK